MKITGSAKMPESNRTQPHPIIGGIYIFINYVIAIITALFVIVLFIGTLINKTTHWHLKSIHIQFFICALISCSYHLLNITSVPCEKFLPLEIITTFPMVSQLNCMTLSSYLMFKEELESYKAKIYVITFIFVNWIPALALLMNFTKEYIKPKEFFCRFIGGTDVFRGFWITTTVFHVFFYVIMFFLFKKLKQLKSDVSEETEVILKIYKKVCIQFVCGILYTVVMTFFIFFKAEYQGNVWFEDEWFYVPGILYNLSVLVMCFLFVWSANLRNSISKIPFLGFLAQQQSSSDENNGVTLM